MKIEPIKPIIMEIPTEYEQIKEEPTCVRVIKSEKYQNGWDFGEEKDLIGKVNKIIESLNNLEAYAYPED